MPRRLWNDVPMSHHYETHIHWDGNRGSGTATYADYGREHHASTAGKPEVLLSADPTFRGDAERHNPEDLLLIAIASCHMLSYLALCARRGIEVVAYEDRATATMELDKRGGGRFTEAVLHPVVTIKRAEQIERATALDDEAHDLCFIASSCNFPIRHEAETRA
jgi:organic hydroperoxide reductase OsmC/OhrA